MNKFKYNDYLKMSMGVLGLGLEKEVGAIFNIW